MTRWTLLGAALALSAGSGLAFAEAEPAFAATELSWADLGDAPLDEGTLIAQGPRGRSVSAPSGTSVTRSSSASVSRSSGGSVSRSSATTVRVSVPFAPSPSARTAPPPPASAQAAAPPRLGGASASPRSNVQVHINMRPPSAPPPPPPPGSHVTRAPAPPPPAATPYRPPSPPRYYSGSVYVYPRVYSTMWGWWWWSPPTYVQPPPSRRPASPDYAPEPQPQPKPEALHVGAYSFGVWSGVNQGAYRDGSGYSDPGVRFSIRHRATPHLGMDISGGYYSTTLYPEEDRNQRRIDVPLQLSSTFHLFPTLPVQLYGLAGVTVDFRDFQKVGYTQGVSDFYYEDGRFQDTRFGPHFGLGAEVMVGESLSLHGDTRWTYYTLQDRRSSDQTFPVAFSANAGVSFYF